jgi:hypothetical protein
MIRTKKIIHRSVKVADPDFGGASVEVDGAFLDNLRSSVRWGGDLDANGRGSGKRRRWICEQPAFLSFCKQDDVGDSHLPVASKDSLVDCSEVAGVKLVEEIGDSASSLAVIEARGRGHDKLATRVDLETFGPIGEGGIGADFEPPFHGGGVDRDGHTRIIRLKWTLFIT